MLKQIYNKIMYWIRCMKDSIYIKKMQLFGYMADDFSPMKCPNCKGDEFTDCNEYRLDGPGSIVLEYDCKCEKCNCILGHWAYGYWNPLS